MKTGNGSAPLRLNKDANIVPLFWPSDHDRPPLIFGREAPAGVRVDGVGIADRNIKRIKAIRAVPLNFEGCPWFGMEVDKSS